MMKLISGQVMDQERALYGLRDAKVVSCRFEGPADGESALKECACLSIEDCDFLLRYPLWHVRDASLADCRMTDTCRAALWYDEDIRMTRCSLGGIKALRECRRITLTDCTADSTEFGWFCQGIDATNLELHSEYPFLHTTDLTLEGLRLTGKYSFQYVENAVIRHSVLATKDAFWHSRNVTVEGGAVKGVTRGVTAVTSAVSGGVSPALAGLAPWRRLGRVKGEYLAWYSEGLTLRRCRIIGTQPLCYAERLTLEDCEMVDADLSFENSTVQATLRGHVISVKNPTHGSIEVEDIGEIIWDEHQRPGADCRIVSGGKVFAHP